MDTGEIGNSLVISIIGCNIYSIDKLPHDILVCPEFMKHFIWNNGPGSALDNHSHPAPAWLCVILEMKGWLLISASVLCLWSHVSSLVNLTIQRRVGEILHKMNNNDCKNTSAYSLSISNAFCIYNSPEWLMQAWLTSPLHYTHPNNSIPSEDFCTISDLSEVKSKSSTPNLLNKSHDHQPQISEGNFSCWCVLISLHDEQSQEKNKTELFSTKQQMGK